MVRRGKQDYRDIVRSAWFPLILVTSIAIIIRSIPGWLNAAWGCDFGIYYSLTNSFVESGELFNPYYGWGSSYQYFPVLYAITGGVHWITGLDVLTIMPKVAPIFGGLSVLIFYFIVRELTGDKKIAFFSSFLLAVMPFHVYQTSHASPLTVGHFFMMLCLYFFIRYRRDIRFFIPLAVSTLLLVMSHHFTTYFYLISLVFIVFVENAGRKNWTVHVKPDILYILGASTFIFSYWIFIATPVFYTFMSHGIKIGAIRLSSTVVVPLFYVFFLGLFVLVLLKRRFGLFIKRKRPSAKRGMLKVVVTLSIFLFTMGVFSFVKMPWTNFSFTLLSIVYSIPLLLVVAFGVAGFRYLRFVANGGFIKGWFLGIMLSFVYALVMRSSALYPHRHIEYLMAPVCVLTVLGLKGIFLDEKDALFSRWKNKYFFIPQSFFNLSGKLKVVPKRQLAFLLIVVVLVTSNAVSVYPSHVALNASYEVITDVDIGAIEWMDEYLDKNNSVIASDHRLARMAEAVGFNTTVDEAIVVWNATNLSEYLFELEGLNLSYDRITHVLIDDVMRDRVVHVGFGFIVYMDNDSYDKFKFKPFDLVYRNASFDDDMVEVNWVEIYEVDWDFVEKVSLIENELFQSEIKTRLSV